MYPIPEKIGAMFPNNLTGPDFTIYIHIRTVRLNYSLALLQSRQQAQRAYYPNIYTVPDFMYWPITNSIKKMGKPTTTNIIK